MTDKVTPPFVVTNISAQGIGIAQIDESFQDTGFEILQHSGNAEYCELNSDGKCSDDNLLWSANDMGSPYFCTEHFFPQEQLGYEFVDIDSQPVTIELTHKQSEFLRDILTAVRLNWKILQTPEINRQVLDIRDTVIDVIGGVSVKS